MWEQPEPVNHHVKAPFKHSIRKPSSHKETVSPSAALKLDTLWATRQLSSLMYQQPAAEEKGQVQGKLQKKGKLMPLSVVHSTGPTINHCRGIVSARSRTLERRKHLMSTLVNNQYFRQESAHNTSFESDFSHSRPDEMNPHLDLQPTVFAAAIVGGGGAANENPKRPLSSRPRKSTAKHRPLSTDSTRSILKDILASTDVELNFVKNGEKVTLSQDRPVSALDPRKSVRFVEEPTVEVISARNRWESATPRLSPSAQVKQSKRVTCKPTELHTTWSGGKDDDDDDKGEHRKEESSLEFLVTKGMPHTSNGEKKENSGKQNDGHESKNTMKCANNLMFTSNTIKFRPTSAKRHPSRLVAWGETQKPEVHSLEIKGSKTTETSERELKHRIRYDFDHLAKSTGSKPWSARPDSAIKGKLHKGRPSSARELYKGAQHQLDEDRGQINSWKFYRAAGGAGLKGQPRKRPFSGLCMSHTAREMSSNSRQEVKLALQGGRVKGVIKAGKCGRCNTMSQQRYQVIDQGIQSGMVELVIPDDLLVCGICFELLDREGREKLRERLLYSIKQEEGPELSGEPVDIDKYVMDLERRLDDRQKSNKENHQNKVNMMSTLESLERSLDTVQADLRASLAPHVTTQPEVSKELNPGDLDLGYSSDKDSDTGHPVQKSGLHERVEQNNLQTGNMCHASNGRRSAHKNRVNSALYRPATEVHASNALSAQKKEPGEKDTKLKAEASEVSHQGVEDEKESLISTVSRSSSAEADSVLSDGPRALAAFSAANEGFGETLTSRFPAGCFRLNARPPSGHVYYFAYGLNMNKNRMGTCIKREVDQRLWGLLFGFQLTFSKKGLDEEAGGFPNLKFCSSSSVEGVLYLLKQDEIRLVDSSMGYPEHYEHAMLPVWMCNSECPEDDGLAQYCVPALVYFAQDNYTHKGGNLPCGYAVGQCLKAGEDILTGEYKQFLSSLAQQPSPD